MHSEKFPNQMDLANGDNKSQTGIDSNKENSPNLKEPGENRFLLLWENLSHFGLGESALRVGTHLLSIAFILLAVWAMREFNLRSQRIDSSQDTVVAAPMADETPDSALELPPVSQPVQMSVAGIPRLTLMQTNISSRPRIEVITYEVQSGDTVFGIAEKFGLQPQTILWGNYGSLADNPHFLAEGQLLNILPVDGTYHRFAAGEGLSGIAEAYNVSVEDIINYPGNRIVHETLGDWENPNLEPGRWLIVPGGTRAFASWSAPLISRRDPAVARHIGPGHCGTIMDGPIGFGSFIWPSGRQYLSGYDYSPATNHFAIDIAGRLGEPLWATDAGVIVYAGWNNFGYGNMVVIDHGNGWQTLYAHLEVVGVVCGQGVFQGTPLGSIGSTGKSSGPHIHFEMMHSSYGRVNPWDFLP
ncbi:MAG: M23 family metallopeptidase [Anaerolineales bacterium]|nr:M23 family metallopeptidase [Anaerolineales bacterium]